MRFGSNSIVFGYSSAQKAQACRLCLEGKLSKEHVPPAAAGNQGSREWTQYFAKDGRARSTRRPTQNGFWVKTICQNCNNQVLSGLAKDYAEFVNELRAKAPIYDQAGNFIVMPPRDHRRFIRAVLGMILAIEPLDQFGTHNEDLRRYVAGFLPKLRLPFQVLAFYTRHSPLSGTIQPLHGRCHRIGPRLDLFAGEISLPPFGFVYGFDFGEYDVAELMPIGHWSYYDEGPPFIRLPSRVTVIDSINRVNDSVRFGPESGRI
ncbi:MAG: hypothetical protein R3F60_20320 [bacterium]